jgi:hypothetical protein
MNGPAAVVDYAVASVASRSLPEGFCDGLFGCSPTIEDDLLRDRTAYINDLRLHFHEFQREGHRRTP